MFLTRGKTKGIYFACHGTPEGTRVIFGPEEENANHCHSLSSKRCVPIHFLEHVEVFGPFFWELSLKGHIDSKGVPEGINLL